MSGEEGSEYERVCDESDVLWDEKVVVVVENHHGDDGRCEDEDGELQDEHGLPVGCHLGDEEEKDEEAGNGDPHKHHVRGVCEDGREGYPADHDERKEDKGPVGRLLLCVAL